MAQRQREGLPPVYKLHIYRKQRRLTRGWVWRWRMTHLGNNRIIGSSSESFTNRADCEQNAHMVTNFRHRQRDDILVEVDSR